jgi:hypothetical protein
MSGKRDIEAKKLVSETLKVRGEKQERSMGLLPKMAHN